MSTTKTTENTLNSLNLPEEVALELAVVQKQFPKISEKIVQFWGYVELNTFLDSILFDERGGRQGFPTEVATALIHLYDHHNRLVQSPKTGDLWDHILQGVKS